MYLYIMLLSLTWSVFGVFLYLVTIDRNSMHDIKPYKMIIMHILCGPGVWAGITMYIFGNSLVNIYKIFEKWLRR